MNRQANHSAHFLWASLALMAVLVLALAVSGCGKKSQEVETNPAAGAGSDEKAVDNVDLHEGEFEGEKVENQDVESTTEEPAPAIVMQDVFFAFDKYELSDAARETLNQDGRLLRDNSSAKILIEGHCDERGTVQYNLALGEKRANEAKTYLVDLGISPSRIDIVSYGKEKPFAMGHDEEAWSQNRRAHFVVR